MFFIQIRCNLLAYLNVISVVILSDSWRQIRLCLYVTRGSKTSCVYPKFVCTITTELALDKEKNKLYIARDIVGEKIELDIDKNIKLEGPKPLVLKIVNT